MAVAAGGGGGGGGGWDDERSLLLRCERGVWRVTKEMCFLFLARRGGADSAPTSLPSGVGIATDGGDMTDLMRQLNFHHERRRL
jgi:hypothetical protein